MPLRTKTTQRQSSLPCRLKDFSKFRYCINQSFSYSWWCFTHSTLLISMRTLPRKNIECLSWQILTWWLFKNQMLWKTSNKLWLCSHSKVPWILCKYFVSRRCLNASWAYLSKSLQLTTNKALRVCAVRLCKEVLGGAMFENFTGMHKHDVISHAFGLC